MMFKDLKSGFPVYLLDRNSLHYEQGKVMAVSAPHADITPGNYGKMLVEITIQTDGKQNTYSVSDSEQTAYAGALLISTSKEYIANEVRAIYTQAEEVLAKVSETQQRLALCQSLLEELDTAYKDKQQTEQRFQKIDQRFGGIEQKMDKILSAVNQFLK